MGEICQDMLMSGISLDELVRPGGTAIADEYISALGGDAANEASVLSRLGNRVAFLGRTGTDSQGDFLVDSLKRAGVDTSLVIRKEGCHNIISVCVTKTDHSHSFLVVKGTDALLTFSDVDLSAFAKTRALCIGSLYDLGDLELNGLDQVVMAAKQGGALVFADMNYDMDGHGNRLFDPLYQYIDYLIPSIEEGMYVTGKETPEDIAKDLLAKGAGNVLIKLGADGSYFENATEHFYTPAYSITPVNTIGCGDNFASGFVHSILRGASHQDAVRFGTACGALNALDLAASRNVRSEQQVLDFIKSREA